MRRFAIAAGLAFVVSTMPMPGPAWAQTRAHNAQEQLYSPIGGGGSGGGKPGYPDPMVNSFGKCWIDTDGNPRWGDCPHAVQHAAPKGEHHKKG
jgi:hypothetical protein